MLLCYFKPSCLFTFKDEIRAQRDRLLREKEALQRQMDLFEQVKWQSSVIQEPYSPGSGTDSPSLQRTNWTPDSPSIRPVPPSSVPQALWDTFVHKRSSSEDLHKSPGDSFGQLKQEYSSSLKEPLNGSRDSREPHREAHKNRNDSRSRSDSRTRHQYSPQGGSSGSTGGSGHRDSIGIGKQREVALPIHLMSAANEQKLGQVSQQLPLKLVEQVGGSKTMSHQQSSSGIQQMLPFKLSSDVTHTSGTSGGSSTGGIGTPPGSGTPHHQSNVHHNAMSYSSSSNITSSPHVNIPKHATMPANMNIVSPSSGSLPGSSDNTPTHSYSGSGTPRVFPGRSQPLAVSGLRHQQSQPSMTHSILPMKLATQKRPKSASPSPNHPTRPQPGTSATTSPTDIPKTSSKHSQKSSRKEQEIIYF